MTKKRVTIKQIAEKAGVSVATVDRAINARVPVQSNTSARIFKAAEELGWQPIRGSDNRQITAPEAETVRCGFLLQKGRAALHQYLAEALKKIVIREPSLNAEVQVEFMDTLDPSEVAERMCEMGRQVDALAVVSVDHPFVSEAIDSLQSAEVPVVALQSDLSAQNLAGHIGINNRMCGRTAAWAIDHFSRGKSGSVGLLIGSHSFLNQEDREIGYRSYFREKAPNLSLLESPVCLDDPELVYEKSRELLEAHPEMVGLFSVGGGTAGLVRAMREYAGPDKPFCISIELTAQTRIGLIEGLLDLVIAPEVEQVARAAIEMLIKAKRDTVIQKHTRIMPFSFYTSENI